MAAVIAVQDMAGKVGRRSDKIEKLRPDAHHQSRRTRQASAGSVRIGSPARLAI